MTRGHQAPQPGDDLPRLSAPVRRALAQAGISRLDQLAHVSEAEIKRLHGIGPNAVDQLRRALDARGLSFVAESSEP